jgi:hypothetical protein
MGKITYEGLMARALQGTASAFETLIDLSKNAAENRDRIAASKAIVELYCKLAGLQGIERLEVLEAIAKSKATN